jgi:RNA polymerase sigma factor for flagellar operon FliA
MIVENLPLVGYLVSKVCAGANHLSREDLAQAGSIALIQAVDAFTPERGIPFGAYARERIIGAIKDEMRGNDWAKRAARQSIKSTLAVRETLTAQLGRFPSVDEIAGALGVDRATAAEGLAFAGRTVTSIDASVEEYLPSEAAPTETELLVSERLEYLTAAMEALPERMRAIVSGIYLEDKSVGDIAAELGVTHSAISQQRSEAIRLMRDGMDAYYSDSEAVAPTPLRSTTGSRQTSYLADLSRRIPVGSGMRHAAAI